MIDNGNNTKNIAQITVLETAEDVNLSAEVLSDFYVRKKNWRNILNTALKIVIAVNIVLSAAQTVMSAVSGKTMYVLSSAVLLLFFSGLFFLVMKSGKKSKANYASMLKKVRGETIYAGGFYPSSYTFGEDELVVENKFSKGTTKYENFESAAEFAEGLYINSNQFSGRGIWIPARFIPKEKAGKITETLKNGFGRKYTVFSPLCAAQDYEQIQPEKLLDTPDEKLMTIELSPNGKSLSKSIAAMVFSKIKAQLLLLLIYVFAIFVGCSDQITGFINSFDDALQLLTTGSADFQKAFVLTDMLAGCGIMIFAVMIAVILVSGIVSWIISGVKSYRALIPVTSEKQIIYICDDVITGRTATGGYVFPWKDVAKAVRKDNGVQIFDIRNKYLLISDEDAGEQKTALCELITQKLGKGWHSPEMMKTSPNQ